MGRLSGTVLAVLLLCSGCGQAPRPSTAQSTTSPQFVLGTPWPTEASPKFTTASPDVRRKAVELARAACEYDARTDGARPRVLRERGEHAELKVNGVSQSGETIIVTGTLMTTTDFATVRSFITVAIRDGIAGGCR